MCTARHNWALESLVMSNFVTLTVLKPFRFDFRMNMIFRVSQYIYIISKKTFIFINDKHGLTKYTRVFGSCVHVTDRLPVQVLGRVADSTGVHCRHTLSHLVLAWIIVPHALLIKVECHKFLYKRSLVFFIWSTCYHLSITWYWLWLILYEFFCYLSGEREKMFSLANKIRQCRIFVMNGCKLRLSDKIH